MGVLGSLGSRALALRRRGGHGNYQQWIWTVTDGCMESSYAALLYGVSIKADSKPSPNNSRVFPMMISCMCIIESYEVAYTEWYEDWYEKADGRLAMNWSARCSSVSQ